MKSKVQKWGNSLGLRIPKSFAKEAKLSEGSSVDIHLKGETLIVQSAKPAYKLKDLLAGITAANLHREVDTGSRRGKEAW